MPSPCDFLIVRDDQGGEARLTTWSPQSHYGCLVLRVEGDFGPADIVGRPGQYATAADIVAGWAAQPGRTADELGAARRFLQQWPDGPQIGGEA